MQLLLKKDLKDLGKAGEIVSVKAGFARNFLLPRQLAVPCDESRKAEWAHLQKVAQIKAKKAVAERKSVAEKLQDVQLMFERQASQAGRLFGSVSPLDISKQLDELGFAVDKRDIHIHPLKEVGEHKVPVKLGPEVEVQVALKITASAPTQDDDEAVEASGETAETSHEEAVQNEAAQDEAADAAQGDAAPAEAADAESGAADNTKT